MPRLQRDAPQHDRMPLSTDHPDYHEFIDFLRLKNLAAGSISAYESALKDFFAFCPDAISSFQDVSPPLLRSYIAGLQEKGRASKTLADRVTILKRFFGYLYCAERIPSDPAQRLPNPKVGKRLPKALTLEETGALLAALAADSKIGARNRALLELLYVGGLRVSEAVGLRVEDIDFAEGAIRVMGKGSRERRVYLKPDFVQALRKYVETNHSTGFVFPGRDKGHLTSRAVQFLIKQYAKKAGVTRRVTPHVLRHSIAVHYLQGGAPVSFVQGLLGHASLATTGRYLQLTDQMMKEIALRIETAYDRVLVSEKKRRTREARPSYRVQGEFELLDTYVTQVLLWIIEPRKSSIRVFRMTSHLLGIEHETP